MASTTITTTTKSRVKFKSQPIPTGSGYLTRHPDPVTFVSPDYSCFPSPPPPRDFTSPNNPTRLVRPDPLSNSHSDPISTSFSVPFSPGSLSPVMDFTATAEAANGHGSPHESSFPSSFTKFNSALTAGLLNPMSPPPPPPLDKTRSSPTLFEMMASEADAQARAPVQISNGVFPSSSTAKTANHLVISAQDKQAMAMQRISDLLWSRSPGNQFNDPTSSDVNLTLSSKDGISVTMSVHRQILVAHSRFFAVKLSDRWARQQRPPSSSPYIVEISDCDDVEVYIETLMLMYCRDLRKKLMRQDVPRVLGILKVSAAIGFDAGVVSCLEYLEAAPWAEDEEEKIASLLSELHLENVGATEVLRRVSVEVCSGNSGNNSSNDEVLLKLLHVVLEGKDEKARRDMKNLVSKMLRENSSGNDLRKESLYFACDGCLQTLKRHFLHAAASGLENVNQIARQADNLHWVLDILIDRQIAEDFLTTWASLSELSEAHAKVPAVHRYEISRVTARLFVGIGKGQILAPKEVRCLLLRNWLTPFYSDFGWMRRASKGLDRYLIEDGLSNTILTLPLAWQQDFFLAWFDRFLNSSEDCPNLQRGFEVWWRRAFWRRKNQQEEPAQLRITAATVENS